MGTALTGLEIRDTYDALIKVTDNGPLDGTLQTLTDGLGNDSALALSTAGASVTGTFAVSGNSAFDTTTLVVDATNNRVGVGTASPSVALHTSGIIRSANAGDTVFTEVQNDGLYATATDLYLLAPATKFVSIYAGGAERVRITDAGNVGVGTSTPTSGYKFDVRGRTIAYNSGYIADFVSTASNASSIQLYADNTNVSIVQGGTAAVPMTFFVGASERMRISTAGNVGIGTSSPNAVLEVAGVAKATFSVLTSENSISSAAEASRFFAVSGDTGATSYNGTSIGQAAISGFSSVAYFVVGGFKPILPKGWTGTIVLEANADAINLSTTVSIQTSTNGSSWTTQVSATTSGTLTYTASSGLSADTFLRIELSSGSGAGVGESACRFANLRINSYNVLMDAFHQGEIEYPSLNALSIDRNVGIGTSSPRSKLDVATSATEALFIGNTSTEILSGDLLGAISFGSRDSSTYSSGGITNIRSYATTSYNTGNVSGDIRFYTSDSLQNTTGAALFGSEAMRITSAGNVGIGTSAPANKLTVSGTGSYDGTLVVTSTGSGTPKAILGVDAVGSGLGFVGTVNNVPFQIRTNDVTRLRVDADGLKFGSDTLAANALDDYEEGIWTPQVYYQNATDQANATNVTQVGTYTKIGRLVTITCVLQWTITGSPAADNVGVKNLPFASTAGADFIWFGPCQMVNAGSYPTDGYKIYMNQNSSLVLLYDDRTDAGNYGIDVGASGTKTLRFSFTYSAS